MTVIRSILLVKKKKKEKEKRKEILECVQYFAHKGWHTFLDTSDKFASLKDSDDHTKSLKSLISLF